MDCVNTPKSVLTEDQLFEVAERRAYGAPWETAARVIGWRVDDLKRAVRNNPAYRAALDWVKRDIGEAAEAQMQQELLVRMNCEDNAEARRAAEVLADFRLRIRRNETELELARVNAETKLEAERIRAASREQCARIRAQAQAAKSNGRACAAEEPRVGGRPPVDEEPDCDLDAGEAGGAIRADSPVDQWGGRHAPDQAIDASDTALTLLTPPHGAVPPDPRAGPFLDTPGPGGTGA